MEAYSTPGSTESEYSVVSRTRAKLYKNGVYPERVRDTASTVLQDVEDSGVERYNLAARLTQFVYEEVENVESSSRLLRPDYLLEHVGEGDCEDQTVLLASLLEARSFETRFVSVSRNGVKHLMLQVRFPFDKVDNLTREAQKFYDVDVEDLAYERDEDDGAWLLCDPVWTPVVGTVNDNFCTKTESGGLEWFADAEVDRIETEDETVVFL
jgi:transglutaminase-like putative cysteine protease